MSRIPEIFKEPLFQSSPIFEPFKIRNKSDKLRLIREYKSMFGLEKGTWTDITFSSRFNGIFPEEIKEKINETERIFNKELYLIAETKPEEWNVQVIKSDPLLTGVYDGKCFLVDHFNTTSIENYVRREFTS